MKNRIPRRRFLKQSTLGATALGTLAVKGRHPIGRIALGRGQDNPMLDGVTFDDLSNDNTLGYCVS